MKEYTEDWKVRELGWIDELCYYQIEGVDNVTIRVDSENYLYAEPIAHLIAASPRMARLLERLVNDGWNASISEEAKDILALPEGR